MKSFRKISMVVAAACISAMACFFLAGCSLTGSDYTPELKSPDLKPPAVGQEGTLRVGVNTSNSPLAGASGDKIIGIDVDVAAAIGDNLGLKVDIRDVGTDGKQAIDNGNVDIVLGVDKDTSEKGMWLSTEYIPTGIVLFATATSEKGAPKTSDNVKIGAQISSKSAWAITNAFGEKKLVSESDLATAFQALEAGEVDYVASDAIVGLYAANRQNVPVRLVGTLGATTGYCVMANKEDSELTNAINESISKIVDDGVMNVIERKWLNNDIELADLPKLDSSKTKESN